MVILQAIVLASYKRNVTAQNGAGLSISQEGAFMWRMWSPYYVYRDPHQLRPTEVLAVLRHPAVDDYDELTSSELHNILSASEIECADARETAVWIVAQYGVSRKDIDADRREGTSLREGATVASDSPKLSQAKIALERLSRDELDSVLAMLTTFKKTL